jgi:D-alanyl-D-alanine carboxypeptidase
MQKRVESLISVSFMALAMLLGLSGCGSSLSSVSPQTGALGNTVDSLAQAEIQAGVPGMTVALAKHGTILYAQGYGVTNLSTKQATDPKILFEIGSITKQFTAALIMKLQEQGRLQLDDSVTKYMSAYSFPTAITIRMLLTHTSGLADFTNFPDFGQWVRNGISEQAALTEIAQAGLQFQPGTKWAYSNSNYYLLGSVIEGLTGQSYADNLNQSIFQPLALQNTYYVVPPANLSATGYTNNGAGLVPARVWDRSAAFAAGALSTNIDDLARWDNALLSGQVVSPASFQQMTTPDGFYQNGFSYGFGLQLSTYGNRKLMWHNGQIGGFTAETAVFLDNGFTVIVLTNDQDYDTDQFVLKVVNAVCGSSQLGGNC